MRIVGIGDIMKKMNISLPDDLYEQVKKYRDRTNYSKICQEAIKKEIAKYNLPKEVKEMEATIERLKESKEGDERHAYESGFEWGKEYAEGEADYAELKNLATGFYQGARIPDYIYENYMKEIMGDYSEEEYLQVQALMKLNEFNEGFFEGVRSVWNVVKEKV